MDSVGITLSSVRWGPFLSGMILIVLSGCMDLEDTRLHSDTGQKTTIRESGSLRGLPGPIHSPLMNEADRYNPTAKMPKACIKNVCELTLEKVIELALERNISLLNRRLDRKTDKLSLEIAENRYTPKFTVSTNANRTRNDTSASASLQTTVDVPTGGSVNFTVQETNRGGSQSLTFRQPLLKGAGIDISRGSLDRARLSEQRKMISFRRSVADLVVQVIGAYRSLAGAIRQAEISKISLDRAYEQLKATQALIRAGRVAERETVRSEAAIANGELSFVRAQNTLESAQYNLIDILELESDTIIRPLEELKAVQRASVLTPTFEDVLRNRSDYLQALIGIETAKIELTRARNNMLPDLALDVGLRRNEPQKPEPTLGLSASVPLSNKRERRLELMTARNALLKEERNIAELRESIRVELRQAVNDVEVNFRLTELARDARDLAEQNLETEQGKFEQGLASSSDVATSEQELVRSEQAQADAIVAYLGALTKLDTVTGQTLERWGIQVDTVSQ